MTNSDTIFFDKLTKDKKYDYFLQDSAVVLT